MNQKKVLIYGIREINVDGAVLDPNLLMIFNVDVFCVKDVIFYGLEVTSKQDPSSLSSSLIKQTVDYFYKYSWPYTSSRYSKPKYYYVDKYSDIIYKKLYTFAHPPDPPLFKL